MIIAVGVTEDQKRKLDAVAESLGMPVSVWIRSVALKEALGYAVGADKAVAREQRAAAKAELAEGVKARSVRREERLAAKGAMAKAWTVFDAASKVYYATDGQSQENRDAVHAAKAAAQAAEARYKELGG